MVNQTHVSLRVDVISNICWKRKLSISYYKRNFLFELLYSKDNLADQINKNNFKKAFEHFSNTHELL